MAETHSYAVCTFYVLMKDMTLSQVKGYRTLANGVPLGLRKDGKNNRWIVYDISTGMRLGAAPTLIKCVHLITDEVKEKLYRSYAEPRIRGIQMDMLSTYMNKGKYTLAGQIGDLLENDPENTNGTGRLGMLVQGFKGPDESV